MKIFYIVKLTDLQWYSDDSVVRDLERDRGKETCSFYLTNPLLLCIIYTMERIYHVWHWLNVLSKLEMNTMGKTKLFLSHSSQDAKVVTAFVNFMLTIGLKSDDIICTSVPSTKISNDDDDLAHILSWLYYSNMKIL